MLYKHKHTQYHLQNQKKEKFVGVSIVLVRHTLQQGNVVSFQHDPPWET